jgi:hypothetical protein
MEELLDLDLDVEVTVLNGAVSGVLFVPPYLISNGNGRIRNVLTDPIAIESNEIHWFAIPLQMAATQAQRDASHDALFSTCEQVAPGKDPRVRHRPLAVAEQRLLDPPRPGHRRHHDGESHLGRAGPE